MPNRQPLNERQLEVLEWIADGCPDGVWSDFTYKHTCYALADRGLADVDKRKASWSAAITDLGRHYLEHSSYPGEPDRGVAAKPERTLKVPTRPRKPAAPRPVAKSDQLVADVIAAGGRLEVSSDRNGRPNYSVLV